MKFLKIKLLVIALVMFAASSAFASLSYESVTVNTNSLGLAGQSGYLYLQYVPFMAAASTATVSGFATDGILGATAPGAFPTSGQYVTGTLPGTVTFANTNVVNDYNQAITFGNTISFLLTFNMPASGVAGGSSTFSLGLFADALGITPLVNLSGGNYAGTALTVTLDNNGTVSGQVLVNPSQASAVPIPAAAWLLGSGLMGLVGLRKRAKKLG